MNFRFQHFSFQYFVCNFRFLLSRFLLLPLKLFADPVAWFWFALLVTGLVLLRRHRRKLDWLLLGVVLLTSLLEALGLPGRLLAGLERPYLMETSPTGPADAVIVLGGYAQLSPNLRWTPFFRPRSAENKRDFCGLLSLLFLLVCRSFRVSKPFRKERTNRAEHCPSSLSVFLGFPILPPQAV